MTNPSPQASAAGATADTDAFAARLETQGLIVLPGRPFELGPQEADLLDPSLGDGKAKNISLGAGGVRGAGADEAASDRLAALMRRYRDFAKGTLVDLAPRYAPWLETGRTSLRTRSVEDDAPASRRKDDRRLHVDAFASQPTGGRRILRVFTNINPHGEARLWRVGEPFEAHARRFIGGSRRLLPGEAALLRALGITRARRTAYDQLMLQLHDHAKLDEAYQRSALAADVRFEAGASWIVFTDSVVHAAIGGRFALEQTFYLAPEGLAAPEASPARILQRLAASNDAAARAPANTLSVR
jgi:hypothetical protein